MERLPTIADRLPTTRNERNSCSSNTLTAIADLQTHIRNIEKKKKRARKKSANRQSTTKPRKRLGFMRKTRVGNRSAIDLQSIKPVGNRHLNHKITKDTTTMG